MLKSITFKLWLTITCTLVLSLSTLIGLSHYSTHKRFILFSQEAIEEQLPLLAQSISSVYERHQNLSEFTKNPRLWQRTIFKNMPFTRTGPTTEPDKRSSREKLPLRDLHASQKQFASSLSLYDAKKQLITGEKKTSGKALWHPVHSNELLIGYIAYEKPHRVLRQSEEIFLQEQLKFFVYLSIAVLITAMFIAAFISRRFVRPLSQISQSAKQVANGNYKTTVEVNSVDELGQLCANFNHMTARLHTNEQARRQWVADISHEMRTPISVLKGQIEAIQDGIRPASVENLSMLGRNVDGLSHIIDDLFELALSDIGMLRLETEATNIQNLLNDFYTSNLLRAEKAGIKLNYTPYITPPHLIHIDPRRIQQVLDNLLENSLRYTDAPGSINLSLTSTGKETSICIDDSAPNVPEEEMHNIFERLYRLEKSRNRATGGAGLGLALAKTIIEAHSGHIEASQSSIGGLKITLYLPNKTDR